MLNKKLKNAKYITFQISENKMIELLTLSNRRSFFKNVLFFAFVKLIKQEILTFDLCFLYLKSKYFKHLIETHAFFKIFYVEVGYNLCLYYSGSLIIFLSELKFFVYIFGQVWVL